MSKNKVEEIINYSISNNYCPIISCVESGSEFFYCDKKCMNNEAKDAIKKLKIQYTNTLDMIKKENIISIYSFGKVADSKMQINIKAKTRIYNEFIHFTNENCCKQKAIEFIKRKYNKNYVIAFGNETNDYEMLDNANESYWIGENKTNKEYKKLPFDDGKSIMKIIKEDIKNEDINDT